MATFVLVWAVVSARDLAKIVEEGLEGLPADERREFFALMSPLRVKGGEVVTDQKDEVEWPDQQARLKPILGDRILPTNPVIEERESSLW